MESEGFIVSFQKRGIQVKEISYKEVIDMYEVVLSMLTHTLDSSISRGYSFPVELLEDLLDQQIEASKTNYYRKYVEYSLLFRRAVISACNNESMLQIMDSIRDKMIMKSVAHWTQTPHLEHYSANQINESAFKAIRLGHIEEANRIFIDAFDRLRGRTMLE